MKYIVSSSGVKVWKRPEDHPLLAQTDTLHPALQRKLQERFPPRMGQGLPMILSENSEDARTWHYFSPLLTDDAQRTRVLTHLLRQAFFGAMPPRTFRDIPGARMQFWPKLPPPPSRPQAEGESEPDLLIELGESAVVLVEAKCRSGVSEFTKFDRERDQVIRLIDVGSWYAREAGFARSFVLVLQYGDWQINAEKIVNRYKGSPDAVRKALPYRDDITAAGFARLAEALAFARWPDPVM